jgi:uncharacterized repeat protein (TIGR03803 family)
MKSMGDRKMTLTSAAVCGGSVRRLAGTASLVIAVMTCLSGAAWSQTKLVTLHSFCSKGSCADGDNTFGDAPLVEDTLGNFYGTTPFGGSSRTEGGTVFQLSFDSAKGKWLFKTIYDFPKVKHGIEPAGPLIVDTQGDLYGTTTRGGTLGNGGVVFELKPNADRTKWKQHMLYAFCPNGTTCPDGAGPLSPRLTYAGASAGALYDGTSPLFGTTIGGGANNKGTVFELSLNKATHKWSESVIYNFCSVGSNCLDGYEADFGVTMDGNGNLFGPAWGGTQNWALIYELSPAGGGNWNFTVLYNFCGTIPCVSLPQSPLLVDTAGNLYGTALGGANANGAIFKLIPNGANSQFFDLYDFCKLANCLDGRIATASLAMDASGNLYGTTKEGGTNTTDLNQQGGGTAFVFGSGQLQTLYDFCARASCADGEYPLAGVTLDGHGNLFGATSLGGTSGRGTVFELTPAARR